MRTGFVLTKTLVMKDAFSVITDFCRANTLIEGSFILMSYVEMPDYCSAEDSMFCPNCGSQQSETHVFCDRCGANLSDCGGPSFDSVTIEAGRAKRKRSKAAVGFAVAAVAMAALAIALVPSLFHSGVLGGKAEESPRIDARQKQEVKQEEVQKESLQAPKTEPEQEHQPETEPVPEQAPRSPLEASAGFAPHDDFWGVWVGASESEADAQAIAQEASSRGLPAEVVLTTDWANLNREPWYVVGVGRFASEEEAQPGLAAAQQAGYMDAYVKYSASYVGE